MKGYEGIIELLSNNIGAIPVMIKQEKQAIIDTLREVLLLNHEDYDIEIRKKAFRVLIYIIGREDTLDIRERWGNYLNAVFVAFAYADYDNFIGELRHVYYSIVKCIEGKAWDTGEISADKIEIDKESAPVVIVTSQFLNEGHAPTRRVLDYAYTIITKLNRSVIIVNDAGMYCDHTWAPFYYMPEYNDVKEYIYKEVSIPFYQAHNKMPDLDEMICIWKMIRDMRPVLVLNVGANSVLSDMCRLFTKTASIPCAIDLPVSMSEYLLLPRESRESDEAAFGELLPFQKVVNTFYNYIYPKDRNSDIDRGSYNINDKDFVISTIGNRLDEEIDEEFLKAVDQILLQSNVIFILFGEVVDRDRIMKNIKNKDQLRFAGKVANAGEYLKITDVYVNPKRTGGGRSAFEALYQGKPVVTLKYGDVWGTAGDCFAVEDYDQMINMVLKMRDDNEYYKAMSQEAKNRSEKLEDMETTFRELFVKLDI